MPNRINKLLCPTDGSHAAEKGVDFAVNIAKNFSNIELTFLVITRVAAGEVEESRYRGAAIVEAADVQEHRDLDASYQKAKDAGLENVQCARAYGRNIAAAIIGYAETEKFDHIIIGSTGRTGVSRVLLGSVAAEVVQKAHCPVTVVR